MEKSCELTESREDRVDQSGSNQSVLKNWPGPVRITHFHPQEAGSDPGVTTSTRPAAHSSGLHRLLCFLLLPLPHPAGVV